MEKIKNIKKTLVLGVSGTLVECMLLDSIEEIKEANPKLTSEELAKAYEVLQTEIERIKSEQENEQQYLTED